MAASLAAVIESAFGIDVTLAEGHDGVYEVAVDDEIVYSNGSKCSNGFPTDEHIVEAVGSFLGLSPDRGASSTSRSDRERGPFRVLSDRNSGGEECCGPEPGDIKN